MVDFGIDFDLGSVIVAAAGVAALLVEITGLGLVLVAVVDECRLVG